MLTSEQEYELATLLNQRLEIIADHSFRDRDQNAHLQALIQVSQQIETFKERHKSNITAQLRHYLDNASYTKALAWLGDKQMLHRQ